MAGVGVFKAENEPLDAFDRFCSRWVQQGQDFVHNRKTELKNIADHSMENIVYPYVLPVFYAIEPQIHFALDVIEAIAHIIGRYIPRSFYECRSNIRFKWEVFVFALTMYSCITIPYRFTFGEFGGYYVALINFLVDVVFFAEIPMNFKTGFIEDGLLVMNSDRCRVHYWKTWFFYDSMAFFPLYTTTWMLTGSALPELSRVPRIMRMARFEHYFSMFEMRSSLPDTIRLAKLFLIMFILIHWVSCAYFFIGIFEGFGSTDFVPSQKYGESNVGQLSKYLIALYFATAVLTGIGNIANPHTDLEIWFCLFCMVAGFLLFATIIGNIGEVLANMHATVSQFRQKMSLVEEYMNQRNIPKDVQARIRQHYGYLADRHQYLDDNAILEEMPSYLKREIALFMNYETLMKVNIFKDSEPGFINSLVLKLRAEVFSPNNYIFRKGEIGNEMFFINRGTVEVCSEDGNIIYAVLSEGSYFGEVAILLKERRTASVRAKTFCDLFSLAKQDLFEVISDYPEQAAKMLHEAEARITETRGKKTSFEARKEWQKAINATSIALIKPKRRRRSSKAGKLGAEQSNLGLAPEMLHAAKKYELGEVSNYAKALTHSSKRTAISLGVAHSDEVAHAMRRNNSTSDIPREKECAFEVDKKSRAIVDQQKEKLMDIISTLNKAAKDTGHGAPPRIVRQSVTAMLLRQEKPPVHKPKKDLPLLQTQENFHLSQKELLDNVQGPILEIVARSSGSLHHSHSRESDLGHHSHGSYRGSKSRIAQRRSSFDHHHTHLKPTLSLDKSHSATISNTSERRRSISHTPSGDSESKRKYLGIDNASKVTDSTSSLGTMIRFDSGENSELCQEYQEELSLMEDMMQGKIKRGSKFGSTDLERKLLAEAYEEMEHIGQSSTGSLSSSIEEDSE